MTPLPDGFTARPATPDDLEAVTGLMAAYELDLHGEVDTTVEDVRSDWARPSFDLASDTIIALAHGRPAAYADVPDGRRAWAYVSPDQRGRGLGAWLLRWLEEQARELGRPTLEQTVSDDDSRARALLEANGYSVRWHTWIFRLPLDEEPPEPALPPGITLRAFEPGPDDRDVYELVDAAFGDWADRDSSQGFEDWAATTVRRSDFDPSLTLLLEDGQELVGVSFCLTYGEEGWVDQLAVKRSHRGRGLGKALLRASFREFRRRGLRTAGLSTESRSGARALYEHVGMRVVRSYTRFSKQLG